jgi:hypothetical protein
VIYNLSSWSDMVTLDVCVVACSERSFYCLKGISIVFTGFSKNPAVCATPTSSISHCDVKLLIESDNNCSNSSHHASLKPP